MPAGDLRWIAVAVALSGAACLPCGEIDDGNDMIDIDFSAAAALRDGAYRVAITSGADVAEARFTVTGGARACVDLCRLVGRDGAPVGVAGYVGERWRDEDRGFRIELTVPGRGPAELGIVVERDRQVVADVAAAPDYYDQESCSELRAARLSIVLTDG